MSATPGITQLLHITYPVVQGAMLGVSTPEMAAAVSNAGGLGSLPVGGLSPDEAKKLIHATKEKTSRTFAVNLFVHEVPEQRAVAAFDKMQDFLESTCRQEGFPFERRTAESLKLYSYLDQVEVLLAEKIPVVSFTFGCMNDEVIKALKKNGTVLIGTATCLEEAQYLESKGIDAITLQGVEAGGHRGSFLSKAALPQIGLMSLLSACRNVIQAPLLAAGGIADGESVKGALMMGASGVQIGTLFIPADESLAIPAYKEAVLNARDVDTVLTKSISGRWARGINNKLIRLITDSGIEIPDYTLQNSLTGPIRKHAQQINDREFVAMWAGQSSGKSKKGSTTAIFHQLIKAAGLG